MDFDFRRVATLALVAGASLTIAACSSTPHPTPLGPSSPSYGGGGHEGGPPPP